jgi:hypothetical protein
MGVHVWTVIGVSALVGLVVGWLVAWRYGRRRALVVPVLAMVVAVVNVFRGAGLDAPEALARVAFATAFAGPSVAGALVGILLVRRRG